MPYTVINVPEGSNVPAPPPQTWSNMKIHRGGHFHVAGMIAEGATTYDQARRIFSDIKSLVEAAGGAMDDVMTMQIFLVDLDDNQEVWRARREFFSGDFPCSTLIQAVRVGSPKANPPMRVEINCSGYIGGGSGQ
jgi:enamine deaminase RidA (YjgF/YER057c/UK114 family)